MIVLENIPVPDNFRDLLNFVIENGCFSDEFKNEQYQEFKSWLIQFTENKEVKQDQLETAHFLIQLLEIRLSLTIE